MSDKSKIEWTDATWNPVRGCTKISPGCKHCYAETPLYISPDQFRFPQKQLDGRSDLFS